MKIISETLTKPAKIPKVLLEVRHRINKGLRGTDTSQFLSRFDAWKTSNTDFSDVWRKFAIRMLREFGLPLVSDKYLQCKSAKYLRCKSAVERVIAGLETNWANDNCGISANYADHIGHDDVYVARASRPSVYVVRAAAYAAFANPASSYAGCAVDFIAYAVYTTAYDTYTPSDPTRAGAVDACAAAAAAAASISVYTKMADILCEELAAAPVCAKPDVPLYVEVQVELFTAITVRAKDFEDAKAQVADKLNSSLANFGAWDDGTPITGECVVGWVDVNVEDEKDTI